MGTSWRLVWHREISAATALRTVGCLLVVVALVSCAAGFWLAVSMYQQAAIAP